MSHIPAPYDSHDQFPEAWRSATLSALIDLGQSTLAAYVRRAGWATTDVAFVVAAMDAEIVHLRNELPAGAAARLAVLLPLAAAWRAWLVSDVSADPTTAAGAAAVACWRLRDEARAAARALRGL